MAVIEDDMMGEVWPTAQPGPDGTDYGSVGLTPAGRFEVRSFQTFTLTYTVGEYGLDDTGAIKIVHRWTDDGGAMQTDDPAAMNHITARASNGVDLEVVVERHLHQRPWYNGVRITVRRGYMRPGDTITVVYGDRSGGSPGYRLQTFCESAFEFKVLVDACATGCFLPVGTRTIEIVAGPPARWILVAPTLRRPGEAFALGLRAEDVWGNATGHVEGRLRLVASAPVRGLPEAIALEPGRRGLRIGGLSVPAEGAVRFDLLAEDGTRLAQSNPMVVRDGAVSAYWGDLHGQSGETVGINPMREYVEYARDVAFLDVTSHQGNDFQITGAFWNRINALSAEFDEDGVFTVFPGYEWSGNTPLGGDHNVFFRHEGRQIHRSSHALLADRSDIATDAPTLEALFAALRGEDCVLYAHVGGRPADIARAEDPVLRTAVEVHSDWGTFEWILTDAFELGYRVGVVCNSDGHKGAPGACYPGASEFGAYSGLTCFLADGLSRDAVFDSLRARHHYGTTGCRMHLEVRAALGQGGLLYPCDPRTGPSRPMPAQTAIMGDIVSASGDSLDLHVSVAAHAPLERIDVLNGARTVATRRPHASSTPGQRIRAVFQGAEYRGRGRQTYWNGHLALRGATIRRMETFNIWNHEREFRQDGPDRIRFDCITTGNFCGCDLWLDEADSDAQVEIVTDHVAGGFALSDIGFDDRILDAGGLDRRIRVFRLPETLDATDFSFAVPVALDPARDNPIWVRVTTEDGFNAWSSPIYAIPRKP